MKLEFVGRGVRIDKMTRQFTEEKLQKAMRFLEEPVEVRATLEVEKHRNRAHLHVLHRHGAIEAMEEMADMHDAINLAADKVEKQARRTRKRFFDRRRRGARTNGQPTVVAETSNARLARPRIIRARLPQIKPMTIDEAALQLEGSEQGFVVFRDSGSDRVSVLFRRKDKHYGLVTAEA